MKTKAMNRFLDEVSFKEFGRARSEALEKEICVMCGATKLRFRSTIGLQEYRISGLCEACQDKVFGGEDEN